MSGLNTFYAAFRIQQYWTKITAVLQISTYQQ